MTHNFRLDFRDIFIGEVSFFIMCKLLLANNELLFFFKLSTPIIINKQMVTIKKKLMKH